MKAVDATDAARLEADRLTTRCNESLCPRSCQMSELANCSQEIWEHSGESSSTSQLADGLGKATSPRVAKIG